MPSSHITPSGGLLTHQFIEAIQQPSFNHPAVAPETFALPGQKTPAPAELERTIGAAWELLVERWDAIERELPEMDISTLRERWVRPFFFLLDFTLEYQRADLLLEDDGRADGGLRFPISHMGLPKLAEHLRVPVHSLLPAEAGLDARRGSGSGLKRLAPHDLLQRYLNMSREARWGMLTDGLRLRLLRDYHHTYTRGYVEFDLGGIFTGRDFAAFRALYRLCHASRFVPMTMAAEKPAKAPKKRMAVDEEDETEAELVEEAVPESLTPLESFYQHALSTGVKVGEDLRQNVRAAIETFANGFLGATPGLLARLGSGELAVTAFYDDILHTIYRILFLLFAEQRGMFPGRGSLYMEEYSLTALRSLAEHPLGEDPHADLWERLKAAFRMVEHGAPALKVFGYNGALFSSTKTPILMPSEGAGEAPLLRNDSLLSAIRALTTVERQGVLQRISYADLSVEEMGSVYESLLDYTPRIAAESETVENREIHANTFFLDPRGKARKTSGSYYTHPSLVNELIKSALLPVLEERLIAALPGYAAERPESLSEADRQKAEQVLLRIKVIDPAAGSGAFLIAADNTLGLRLAQIRSGDLYPAERDIRRARRDVLAHCLYAVDLNPMAVELCKVSLWINAVVEDERLNFLDHHIKCGNSLVGATRRLVAKGIPSEAYGGASGDDKALVRAVKERNNRELAGQVSAFKVTELRSEKDLRDYFELNRLAQSDPALAEQRYLELQAQSEASAERLAFDLWTAAFFWQLEAETETRTLRERAQAGIEAIPGERQQPPPPTTQDVFQALITPRLLDEKLKACAQQLREGQRFFHWELEFPEVFGLGAPGGFDVVLGNPPWERIKLQEKEFFAVHAPEVAEAPTANVRRKKIQTLEKTNLDLWNIYLTALLQSERTSKFVRYSERFPLTGRGDVNTYAIFAENNFCIASDLGQVGIIVETGIATQDTYKDFFQKVVRGQNLVSILDFENRKKIFPDVQGNIKFCLLTLNKNPGGRIRIGGQLQGVDDLQNEDRIYELRSDDFVLINPNTLTLPTIKHKDDVNLIVKIHNHVPVLANDSIQQNDWGITFGRMLDMTNDAHLFVTFEDLEQRHLDLQGNIFSSENDVWLPLYEAKLVAQYNHRHATFDGIPRVNRFKIHAGTNLASHKEMTNPDWTPLPRYWVSNNCVTSVYGDRWPYSWWIGFRNAISAVADARSVVFSILPRFGVGNSFPLIFTTKDTQKNSCLLANMNSLVLDYVARQKVSGGNLNFFVVKQLPVIPPDVYSNDLIKQIVPKVMELVSCSWDISSFSNSVWSEADDFLRLSLLNQWDQNAESTGGGYNNTERPGWFELKNQDSFPRPPFKWDEERRTHLRSDLDGLYAHLYGLTRDEFAYILDTFPIVRRKDEAKYGEYRTKRLCLEAYDRLIDSDLIPPEARALQGESVIGERAVVPVAKPAPKQDAQEKPGPPPVKAAPSPQPEQPSQPRKTRGRPKGAIRLDLVWDDENAPEEALEAAEGHNPPPQADEATQPGQQMSLGDYGLYQCQACGKMVLGFAKEKHAQEAHKGKEPGYVKKR